ncbi:MAG TPA: hypothetical protein VKU41_24025 [Polyangiaceae bacterium]|nr:hypothetical protein [Polyangiaceae bacterium]
MVASAPPSRLATAWRAAWADAGLRGQLVATPVALVVTLGVLAKFLARIEDRPGVLLSDPVLSAVKPHDSTWLVFGVLYASVVVSLGVLAFHPRAAVVGIQAYVVMIWARMIVMYVTPLDPPLDAIALRDPIIEILGTGRELTRDLFFSGHTSTLFLLFLGVPGRRIKALLAAGTIGVAVGVLRQHVHYTVDVLCAPPFAFASLRLVQALHVRLQGTER